MSADGANEIARRARGTPRIAGRLLRRVRDFAIVEDAPTVTRAIADRALRPSTSTRPGSTPWTASISA